MGFGGFFFDFKADASRISERCGGEYVIFRRGGVRQGDSAQGQSGSTAWEERAGKGAGKVVYWYLIH